MVLWMRQVTNMRLDFYIFIYYMCVLVCLFSNEIRTAWPILTKFGMMVVLKGEGSKVDFIPYPHPMPRGTGVWGKSGTSVLAKTLWNKSYNCTPIQWGRSHFRTPNPDPESPVYFWSPSQSFYHKVKVNLLNSILVHGHRDRTLA